MASRSDLKVWTRSVWDHLIQTREALSMHQITRQFGYPPSNVLTPAQMLESAAGHGFFRTLAATDTQDVRWYAARPRRTQQQPEPESYFQPEARPVRSVFEIAS